MQHVIAVITEISEIFGALSLKYNCCQEFDRWFELEAHSMVWDLVDEPVLREEA